jgi:hypothetical protein
MENINITSDNSSNELFDLQLVPEPIVTIQQIEWEIDQLEKSPNSKNNIKSALKKMVALNFINLFDAEDQFTCGFDKLLIEVKLHVKENTVSKSWPSFLNDIKYCINDILHFDISKLELNNALLTLLKKKYGKHLSANKLSHYLADDAVSEGFEISCYTIAEWINQSRKCTPKASEKNSKLFTFLDEFLAANGNLKNKIASYIPAREPEFSRDVKALELPEGFKKDIDQFIRYKTTGTTPVGSESVLFKQVGLRARAAYKVSFSGGFWQTSSLGVVSSAEQMNSCAVSFAKFIKEKHPTKFDSLSFAHFFDDRLINEYCSEQIAKGTLAGLEAFILKILPECKRKSYTSVYFSSDTCQTYEEWIEHLSIVREELSDYLKFCQDREALSGGRNIEWILDHDKTPSYICNKITQGMYLRQKTLQGENHYSTWRTLVMWEIMRTCPVRIGNYASLDWLGELDKNSLRKLIDDKGIGIYIAKDTGIYHVFVHKTKLKNRKSKNITHINQPLPHLTKFLKLYLKERAKHLNKHDETSSKFSINTRLGVSEGVDATRAALRGSFTRLTYRVIKQEFPHVHITNGINPHAMRHLAASIYLRDNPENYTGLATLLMDNLDTVINTYAKRDDKGNTEKISNWAQNNYKSPFDE